MRSISVLSMRVRIGQLFGRRSLTSSCAATHVVETMRAQGIDAVANVRVLMIEQSPSRLLRNERHI